MIKEKYVNRVKEISLNVTQSKIDSIRKKDITKTGIRVYKDKFIGFAGAIGNVNENELEKIAIKSLDNKMPYKCELSKNIVKHEDYSDELKIADDVVKEFEEVLAVIEKSQPDFIFSNKINIVESETSLTNNDGLDLKYKDKYLNFELIIKEKTSINIFDTGVGFRSRKYNRNDLINLINDTCDVYKNKVTFPKLNKKTVPVIFNSADYVILTKFFQELNGNIFGSNSSLFSGKLGEKVFSDNFTLYQNNDSKNGPLRFFDDEGVINEGYNFPLIKNGVINSPYTDKKTSSKYNLPLTGTATCEYDGVPTLGFPSLKIKESEKSISELLNGEIGIFVDIASGGDFTSDGKFGTPVQVAYLFDGEKKVGRLPELQVSSDIFKMFGEDFVGVSKECINPLTNDKYVVINMEVAEI